MPHVIRYQGRPFTPDGVRGAKNVAVKTPATFVADRTYELYDEDDDYNNNNNKCITAKKTEHKNKNSISSKDDDDKNNNNKATVKITS